jgi:hypothetical protein
MSIFDRLSPERIAKAYQHPEGGKFIRQSDAKQMAAEHKELADGAKKELDNLGEQMRGTPEGAAEAASPADHFAAVGYHVKEAAAHGAAAQTEARQAHTAAAHAHYKAGHANTEASSEKAREATEEAHAASKGNDNFKPVPVRKADVLAGVRKFNENHGLDGRFSESGGSASFHPGGTPQDHKDVDAQHTKLISSLTQHDQRVSANEAKRGAVNIHRMPLLFQAAQDAKATAHKLVDSGSPASYAHSVALDKHFNKGFSPIDRFQQKYYGNVYKPSPGDHVITEGNKYEGMNPDEYMAKLKAETAAEKAKGGHWSKGLNFSKG